MNEIMSVCGVPGRLTRGEPLDQFAEFGLMEGSRVNGELGKWIEDATPGIDRLFNIHYYLKDRKERAAWTLFSA